MNKKTAILLFLAISIFAVALRFVDIDRCLINDELRTIKFACEGIPAIFSAISQDSYPPFSYVCLSAWMSFSKNDVWIHLLFVIFGILSVIVSYMLARYLLGLRYAFIAMFLMAFMPMQIWISQYIRGISPAIFFLLLSTFFFFTLAGGKEKWNRAHVLGYIISSVFAVYSFYLSFFILAAQNMLYLFFRRRNTRQIVQWFLLQAGIFLCFVPWLYGFFAQMKYGNILRNYTAVINSGICILGIPVGNYIRAIAAFLGLDQSFFMQVSVLKMLDRSISLIAIFAFSLFAAVVIVLIARFYKHIANEQKTPLDKFSKKEVVVYFTVLAAVPLLLSIVFNIALKTPLTMRYMAPSSAFLVFVYALMLSEIRKMKIFFAVLALFVTISIFRLADFNSGLVDYRSAAKFISSEIQKDDCLLFIGGDSAYAHYAKMPKHHIDPSDYMRQYIGQNNFDGENRVNRGALHSRLEPYTSVWIYQSGEKMTGITRYILDLIESYGYKNAATRTFRNLEVFHYKKGV